jgi:hypothetical protein
VKPLIVRPEATADLERYWVRIARDNEADDDKFLAAARLTEQRV